MHPVAPGPGVPHERFGAFTEGSGADCNECGTAFPPGTRMLAGGSGRWDDPHRSLRLRWIVGVIAGIPLATFTVVLGWLSLRMVQRFGVTDGAAAGALFTLPFAALSAWGLYRLSIAPIMTAVRGESAISRSTWLVGDDRIDRWSPTVSGSITKEAGSRMLAVSVRAWMDTAGTADARLMVTLHAADGQSADALGAHAGTVPLMIRGLQGASPTMAAPSGVLALPNPVFAAGRVPRTVEPPVLRMCLAPGEPGLEDAAAAARTIAFACIGADGSAVSGSGERLVGSRRPSHGRAWRQVTRIALPIAMAAAAIGAIVCFFAGCAAMWNGGGAGSFMLMFLAPLGGGILIAWCSARRTPIVGVDADSTWETPGGSLVAVDSDPDRRRAIALAVTAPTLRGMEPGLAAGDAGDGESTVTLTAGGIALSSISVRQPAEAALAAARRLGLDAHSRPR